MRSYYGDVYVVQKIRLRIGLNSEKRPTKKSVLKQLRAQNYVDLLDTEKIETLEVYKVDLKDHGPSEVEDEEESE